MRKQKMTKQKKNLLTTGFVLLAVLLFTSCTQEEAPNDNTDAPPAMLGLSVLQAKDLSEVLARAAATTAYPTDKLIGFFVKENTANGYTACNNRKGEYNTTRKLWLPTPDSIWLNNHDADIAVYAPYDAMQTTAVVLRLAACLRPDDGSKDLWCKKFTANNKSTNLAPILEHVYSRFIINLTLDADYKGTASVDSVSLTNDSLYAVGAFRPFETTLYKYEGDAGVGFEISPVKPLTTAAPTANIDLLLIPATLTEDIKLGVTVNGTTFGVKIASSRFAGKLEAGKQYNANVKLKPTALEVTSVTINDWNDETVSGDKEPVFIPQLDPIDIGLSFLIAPGNLRAISDGRGEYVYKFAAEQGYYSGIDGAAYDPSGGDYFCWNTLDPNLTNVTQSSWDNSRDPCRKIDGGQWYVPTKDQLQSVIDKGYIWGGEYIMSDGKKKIGMYFGTTTAPSQVDQDNYLFLPVSGYRDGTICYGIEGHSHYWSSTPGSGAYDLEFASDRCYISTGRDRRNYGFSIRCVKNK